MSWGTVFGVIFGFGLFVGAVWSATDNYVIFLSPESLVMVLGGTLASAFCSFKARYVLLSFRDVVKIFRDNKVGRQFLNEEVGQMIRWGYLVKKEGIADLEKKITELSPADSFLTYAINLVVTGYNGNDVEEMLVDAVESSHERNMVQSKILRYMGATAPAFGMIGTLVGLVIMLDSIGDDAAGLGKGLAIALVTTLYGVLLARLVFIPAANKTQQNAEILRFRNLVMTDGFVMLAKDRSPRFIQDKLNSVLDSDIHFDIDTQLRR